MSAADTVAVRRLPDPELEERRVSVGTLNLNAVRVSRRVAENARLVLGWMPLDCTPAYPLNSS